MRDRLIELIAEGRELCEQIQCEECTRSCKGLNDCIAKVQADHLLKNGVIAPPCKVGDTVYAIACWHGRYVIRDVEVCNYTIIENDWKIVDLYGDYWSANNFGKTVFFTREEAERASKEKE